MGYEARNIKDKSHWLQLRKDAMRKNANGEQLTLEETAVAIWNPESETQPMSCMGILKIEKRALNKLKNKLKTFGIKNLSDIFEPKHREYGHPVSSVYDMH